MSIRATSTTPVAFTNIGREELKKQNEELTNNIKKMQEDNRNKDKGGNTPDPEDAIGALFSEFM